MHPPNGNPGLLPDDARHTLNGATYDVGRGSAYVDVNGVTWISIGCTDPSGRPVFAGRGSSQVRTLPQLAKDIVHKAGEAPPSTFELNGSTYRLDCVYVDNERNPWAHNSRWRRRSNSDVKEPLFTRPLEGLYALSLSEIIQHHCRNGRPLRIRPRDQGSHADADGRRFVFKGHWAPVEQKSRPTGLSVDVWFGCRDSYTVTRGDDELDAWLDSKGWNVDGVDEDSGAVRLVHTGTTPEPVHLSVTPGERLLWDGWHLKPADPDNPDLPKRS